MGLMAGFAVVDRGAASITDTFDGYFQYQMDIIDVYDDLLEEIGETPYNEYFQSFDPTAKLFAMLATTTGGYWLFQNYVAEDKVKGAAMLKRFLSADQSKVLDQMTAASKKQKDEKKDSPPKKAKKRRGPSYTATDVNAAL